MQLISRGDSPRPPAPLIIARVDGGSAILVSKPWGRLRLFMAAQPSWWLSVGVVKTWRRPCWSGCRVLGSPWDPLAYLQSAHIPITPSAPPHIGRTRHTHVWWCRFGPLDLRLGRTPRSTFWHSQRQGVNEGDAKPWQVVWEGGGAAAVLGAHMVTECLLVMCNPRAWSPVSQTPMMCSTSLCFLKADADHCADPRECIVLPSARAAIASCQLLLQMGCYRQK
jgi:hypothetical protein